MKPTVRIGTVLSSGGIRGVFAHTGFLQAIDDLGIPVSAGAGCSAGAVVGGIAASGTDITQWTDALGKVTKRHFWNPDPIWKLLYQVIVKQGRGVTGISSIDNAQTYYRQQLSVQRFEDCIYPFHTVAVSLGNARKTIFSQGDLAPRVLASAAMPILYRPVEIEGDWYCDGALIDLAPIDAICCKHNLDAVIIHHVSERTGKANELAQIARKPWSMIRLLNRILYHHRPWYLSDETLGFHRCPCKCGARVIVIEPELPDLSWPLTTGGAEIMQAATQQTTDLLRPYVDMLLTDPRNCQKQ